MFKFLQGLNLKSNSKLQKSNLGTKVVSNASQAPKPILYLETPNKISNNNTRLKISNLTKELKNLVNQELYNANSITTNQQKNIINRIAAEKLKLPDEYESKINKNDILANIEFLKNKQSYIIKSANANNPISNEERKSYFNLNLEIDKLKKKLNENATQKTKYNGTKYNNTTVGGSYRKSQNKYKTKNKKKKVSKKFSKKQNVKRRCKSLKHRGGSFSYTPPDASGYSNSSSSRLQNLSGYVKTDFGFNKNKIPAEYVDFGRRPLFKDRSSSEYQYVNFRPNNSSFNRTKEFTKVTNVIPYQQFPNPKTIKYNSIKQAHNSLQKIKKPEDFIKQQT